VSGASLQVDEVKVKAEKNRLEINCVPLKPDRLIHLTLRVPAKSTVEVKNNGNRIEVKEPASQTNINASATLIQLNVPEASSLDMRNAPNAFEDRQFGQRG